MKNKNRVTQMKLQSAVLPQLPPPRLILLGFGLVLLAGAPAAVAAADFVKDIQPIFQKICVECHNSDKLKGGLRLDSRASAIKGGKDGVVIVPGDAAKSDLFRRITLPADNDDHMPSKGDLLTKTQTDLIRDWINAGAVWPESAGAKTETAASATLAPAPKPSAAEVKAVAELAQRGIDAREIAHNIRWREVTLRLSGATNFDARTFILLKDIANLYELDLSSIKFTDADLAHIAGLVHLDKLRLEHTPVTDAGLAHLKRLTNLTYLNLFDTGITDAGLEHLKGLTNLKSLFLYQSKVTDQGVAALQKALPQLYINRGYEAFTATKKEEPAAEKKK